MDQTKKYLELFGKRDSICVSHYPVPISKHSSAEAVRLMELNSQADGNREAALYVHVPFCEAICSFCPFNKYIKNTEKVGEYINALMSELMLYANTSYGKNTIIKSVNFGGGTPTSLSLEEIRSIIRQIKGAYKVAEDAMIFIEGNPRNFTYEKLAGLKEDGLNRISVGVQTFQPRIADCLELYHSIEDSYSLVSNAKRAGIGNIGIDLMYNTPGQTLEEWKADIQKSIELGIDHICLIAFCVVPNTRIAAKIRSGMIPDIGDVYKEVELYKAAKELLEQAGYEQYSVIDFAKPGKIDKYASMYFSGQSDLIGIGPAAFGLINGYMYINSGELEEYAAKIKNNELPVNCGEKADEAELTHGMLAKGLRMLSVKREDFKNRFSKEPEELFGETITALSEMGLLKQDAEGLHLTEEGIIWGNNVSKEFFSSKYKALGLQERMKLAKGQPI